MSARDPQIGCGHLCKLADDEKVPIVYVPKFREYGIRVLSGGTSYLGIEYCPMCGQKLAGSLRLKWIEMLDDLGLEPGDGRIPAAMETDEWWIGTTEDD